MRDCWKRKKKISAAGEIGSDMEKNDEGEKKKRNKVDE
tara:strand:- start:2212 stop:2325 length:114 start_codon:yes stop_codon:yes gene_type:complete